MLHNEYQIFHRGHSMTTYVNIFCPFLTAFLPTYLPLTGHFFTLKTTKLGIFWPLPTSSYPQFSGVFSTGATGAIAPAISHLPFQYLAFIYLYFLFERRLTCSRHRTLQNIRIPILQIFVFVYWRGTRKHFHWSKKYFQPIKMCSCPLSINKNKDLENWNSILEVPMSRTS